MKLSIALLIIVGLISCTRLPLKNAEKIYPPELLRDMNYGIVMHVTHYGLSPEIVELEITNNTEVSVQFGADYIIELYDTDKDIWIKFGPPEETVFIAIMYILETGKSQNYSINLFPDKIVYMPGSYRITKKFYENGEIKEYSAPFVLN